MSEPSQKRVRTLDSFLLPHEAPLRQTLYKMIPKIVQLMENKSKETKWPMKAVKEKLQIFPMLKRPSEMEDVSQKITLRDKLTLSSQILAQTLCMSIGLYICPSLFSYHNLYLHGQQDGGSSPFLLTSQEHLSHLTHP